MTHHHPKLLADHIIHLTDARYYAAAGVEKMVFEPLGGQTREQAIMYISALVEWVEGTEIWLRPNGLLNETDAVSLNVTGVVVPIHEILAWSNNTLRVIVEISAEGLQVQDSQEVLWNPGLSIPYEDILNTILNCSTKIWLSIDPDRADSLSILDLPAYGFVLQGTREQATGLKDYSWEEQILEHFDKD